MSDTAEVLDLATNSAVVQLPKRQFPGVVIQGDSLSTIVNDLREIDAALAAGATATARETTYALLQRMEELRLHYEEVLGERGIRLPYEIPPQ